MAAEAGEGAEVEVVPLTPAHAAAVATWRYDGPWSLYDPRDGEDMSADAGYHALVDPRTGAFLGYLCVGQEARVPGLAEEPGVADVGVGLDPALVGRGRGRTIVGPALDWAAAHTGASSLRAVVQAWNERSLRLCARLHFAVSGHHVAVQDGRSVDYVVLRRPVRPRP